MKHTLKKNILALVMTIALSLTASTVAGATSVPWGEQTFKVVAQGKPLAELLRELAARNGVAINVDKGVSGAVNGTFDMRPQALLELLASNFGFVWYFDGTLLQVSPAADILSQIISLENTSVSSARRVIQRLGIVDSRYPVVFDERSRVAKVSGPSRYVTLVAQAIQTAASCTWSCWQ